MVIIMIIKRREGRRRGGSIIGEDDWYMLSKKRGQISHYNDDKNVDDIENDSLFQPRSLFFRYFKNKLNDDLTTTKETICSFPTPPSIHPFILIPTDSFNPQ
ncbi:unnamed protein product [Onchocerca flexuosa]|uniref:Uncharacterized protein n=1 Tax=Onchocerca flexuosa TaxID=387005 RepID=A0A183H5R9_9BILA|nr:unnamed protein product [Onchocerca flexuosa]